MAEFLTRAEYKTWAGIDDTDKDDQIDQLIPAAAIAIKNYTDRDFERDEVTEAREYLYDGSGVLEIDDAKNITEVRVVQTNLVIAADTYQAQTQTGKITWLELPDRAGRFATSPEMGFERNLDRLWWTVSAEPKIRVTATFGWADAEVPQDIKLAAMWAIQAWLSSSGPGGGGLEAESIATFSRNWDIPSTGNEPALPGRSRDLLDPYRRN
jgi:hypothetical protein